MATLTVEGNDPLIEIFMRCQTDSVPVAVQVGNTTRRFDVDGFNYIFENGSWTGVANLVERYIGHG